MIEVFALTWMVAGISATIILSLIKWGFFQWADIHWRPLCRFCIGFWLCLAQTLLIYLCFNQNLFDIAIPFAGASITWRLTN